MAPGNAEVLAIVLEQAPGNLVNSKFEAHLPNANYPLLIGKSSKELIAGLYAPDMVINISEDKIKYPDIYLMNASGDEHLYLKTDDKNKKYAFTVYNCAGTILKKGEVMLSEINVLKVPKSGLLHLKSL